MLGAYLANIQLISKFNKRFLFLLCVINIFSKYAWIVLSKDKNSITIFDVFQEILNESGRKPNKIWADKGNEFYNRSMKSWLQDDIEIYSTHNEGKYVVAERFIRTLKNKVQEYLTSRSKMYIFINQMIQLINTTKYIIA